MELQKKLTHITVTELLNDALYIGNVITVCVVHFLYQPSHLYTLIDWYLTYTLQSNADVITVCIHWPGLVNKCVIVVNVPGGRRLVPRTASGTLRGVRNINGVSLRTRRDSPVLVNTVVLVIRTILHNMMKNHYSSLCVQSLLVPKSARFPCNDSELRNTCCHGLGS